MDLGRFHYALNAFIKDIEKTGAREHFQRLVEHLGNIANNPGQPGFFEQYREQLESTRNSLAESRLNNPRLEIADFLETFDLQNFVGNRLFDSIVKVISEHQTITSKGACSITESAGQICKNCGQSRRDQ